MSTLLARLGWSMGWVLAILLAFPAGAFLYDLSHHDQMLASYGAIARELQWQLHSLAAGTVLVPLALASALLLLVLVPMLWIVRGHLVHRWYRKHPEALEPERRANLFAWITRCRRVEAELDVVRSQLQLEQRRRKRDHAAYGELAKALSIADERHRMAREQAVEQLHRTMLTMTDTAPMRVTGTVEDVPALEGDEA